MNFSDDNTIEDILGLISFVRGRESWPEEVVQATVDQIVARIDAKLASTKNSTRRNWLSGRVIMPEMPRLRSVAEISDRSSSRCKSAPSSYETGTKLIDGRQASSSIPMAPSLRTTPNSAVKRTSARQLICLLSRPWRGPKPLTLGR